MRKFYLTYKDNLKLAQLVREIPWGQNIIILEKLKNNYGREYYLRMTVKHSWSRNILIHQIETKSYERFLTSKKTHNFNKTLPAKISKKAKQVFKILTKLMKQLPAPSVMENKLKELSEEI